MTITEENQSNRLSVAFYCKTSLSSKVRLLLTTFTISSYTVFVWWCKCAEMFFLWNYPRRLFPIDIWCKEYVYCLFFFFSRRTNQILGGLYCTDNKMSQTAINHWVNSTFLSLFSITYFKQILFLFMCSNCQMLFHRFFCLFFFPEFFIVPESCLKLWFKPFHDAFDFILTLHLQK